LRLNGEVGNLRSEVNMHIRVDVPATLSNLGPGFDVVGVALDIHNSFEFKLLRPDHYTDAGVPVTREGHLVMDVAELAGEHFGARMPHGLALVQTERIPRCRGLGSSATARVAGLLAWHHMIFGRNPSSDEMVTFLAEHEGHADNVAAALLGGVSVSARVGEGLVTRTFSPPRGLSVALCIPEREVSTEDARRALPASLSRSDVVFQTSHLALLLVGLFTGDRESLRAGVADRLHHPYRAPLIGPVDVALARAQMAGAVTSFISGSGSTLAAFVPEGVNPMLVARAMARPFESDGVSCEVRQASFCRSGASVDILDV